MRVQGSGFVPSRHQPRRDTNEAPHVLQLKMIRSFLPCATVAVLPCAAAVPALRCHQPPNPIAERRSHRSHPMIKFVSFVMDFLLVVRVWKMGL